MTGTVTVRCYEELNRFLSLSRQRIDFPLPLQAGATVHQVLHTLGIPGDEVDLVLADGRVVDFSHKVKNGERLALYPVFETFDIQTVQALRPRPLRRPRFLADAHLGKLARYLRMLGFDTIYSNSIDDSDLIRIARREGRVLLTRDRPLIGRSHFNKSYLVRETNPRRQLIELMEHFQLRRLATPFRRCLRCNGIVAPVEKEEVEHELDEATRRHYQRFWQCSSCGRIYWKGSHYARMRQFVKQILSPFEG